MIQKKELSKRGLILAMSVLTAGIFGLNQRLDALETRVADDTIPQNVLNLDLCTLAYQLYHQSLCLPLDPWYDIMSRPGSDRRTNIRRFTHDYAKTLGMATATDKHSEQGFYSGPNAARGWANSNLNLDPVLTNYKQIDPKLPMFTRDGAIFLAALAPTYVTENLKAVEGIRYKTKPTSFPCDDVERFEIRKYQGGKDHLVVFEGGTGLTDDTDPAWSLMGFVLMRKTPPGYDAHIVFRGSRSGAALGGTIWKAQDAIGDSKGNPDWITDLRAKRQVEKPLISKVGKVTEGFSEALPTMLGTITACCKHLQQNYPTPEHIYVTGHSLGAALASQFVSATLLGSYGDELRNAVKGWPWEKTKLLAYAQPIPGDAAWAAQFNKISPTSEHYWVDGDVVVEASSNRAVRLIIDDGEHCGKQNKLSKVADCVDNVHEVFVIRAALLRAQPGLSQRIAGITTWAYYDSFSKMIEGQPVSYMYPGAAVPHIVTERNLRNILQNYHFGTEFERWLEQVYARMIAQKSSYIGLKLQKTLDERRRLVLQLVQRIKKPPSDDNVQALDSLVDDFNVINGKLGLSVEEQWIYLGTILSTFQNTTLTLNELNSKPLIKKCLGSKFNKD